MCDVLFNVIVFGNLVYVVGYVDIGICLVELVWCVSIDDLVL